LITLVYNARTVHTVLNFEAVTTNVITGRW